MIDKERVCPMCKGPIENKGVCGYRNVHGIPVEEEVDWFECTECSWYGDETAWA